MVEPVIWTEAVPVFYRIHPDTSVDLDNIRQLLNEGARALMVTHYFGFPQDMAAIRQLCNEKGVILIEDCAHAFFGETNEQPIGTIGDYAIASASKFFPVYDGGLLASSDSSINDIKL